MTTRILFVSHSAELNGAEHMLLDLIGALDSKKYSSSLVIPCPGPLKTAAEAFGCQVRIVPMKWALTEWSNIWKQPLAWLLNRSSVKHIVDAVREDQADIVFSNSAANFCGALAARKAQLPHVWSIHENIYGKQAHLRYFWGSRRLASKIAGSSCKVIVNSKVTGKAFEGHSNVEIVYNGIPDPPREGKTRLDLRSDLGLKQDNTILTVIGKIYKGKGQAEAVQAVERLLWRIPGIKIMLIGDVRNRRYYRRIQKICEQKNMKDRVLFVGHVKDVLDYIRASDLLIIPSSVESFGRTAVEAMSVGTPVLALRAGGLTEIITEGKDGYFIEFKNPENIARAILSIFQAPALNDRLIQAALQTHRDNFSLEQHVSKIENILGKCLSVEH
ncbi:glycosyltransferase family 4 protein [Acidobacteriota bacterium]